MVQDAWCRVQDEADLDMQVSAVSLEDGVLVHGDRYVQMAPARLPLLTLGGDPQIHPRVDTGRDRHVLCMGICMGMGMGMGMGMCMCGGIVTSCQAAITQNTQGW